MSGKFLIFSTTATLLELANFFSMDTMKLCGDILQSGGQLETPGLVIEYIVVEALSIIHGY